MSESTLIILKPDCIQRHLVGQIISRFELKGFKLIASKFMQISLELACEHYAPHRGQSFFKGLTKFLSSGPSLIMVWESEGIIEISRRMIGATFGCNAEPGTIRGDFSCAKRFNLIHGSDSSESAKREINLFFSPQELVNYDLTNAHWIYGVND
jgi:nucleoside-diphosphate kinase